MKKIIPIDLDLSISKSCELEVPSNVTDYKKYFSKSETWKHLKQVLKNAGFFIDNWEIFYEEE